MSDVAAGPAGYLVVGQVRGSTMTSTPAVWTSADGLTWERATPDVFGSLILWGAAVTTSGMVSVGCSSPGDSWRAAVFRSKDGRTWTALPDLPDLLGADLTLGMLRGAAELPDGRLVVAGAVMGTTASVTKLTPLLFVLGTDGKWDAVEKATVPVTQSEASGSNDLQTVVVLGDRALVGGADADGAVIWVGAPAT
jgi:hypothetical protein